MEVEKYKADIVPFNKAREGMALIRKALESTEITDRGSRDAIVQYTKNADKVVTKISDIRIELIRPLKETKKEEKTKYEDAIAPINERIAFIENYATEVLSSDLKSVISGKKNEIMSWDSAEADRIEAERRHIEEEERRQREEQEKKEREAREAEEKRLADIEAKKQKEIAKAAEKKRGIELVKAQKAAEERARIAKEKAEKEAAEKQSDIRIGGAMERSNLVNKTEELEEKKTSGRAKARIDYTVQSLKDVPFEFLLNPRIDSQKLLQHAYDTQEKGATPSVRGILFTIHRDFKYR